MRHGKKMFLLFLLFSAAFSASAANGRKIVVKQDTPAQAAYDAGFAKGIMREGDGAVKLWNRLLIEDDGPGAGTSNKGSFNEPVYGDRVIKKVLPVDDPRCEEAVVVFYTTGGFGKKYPLRITVNGNSTSFQYRVGEAYAYVPIQPSWLRKGDNEITFACPEAKNAGEGYTFYIARADEYKAGGGDPGALAAPSGAGVEGGVTMITKGMQEIVPLPAPLKGIGTRSLISTNGGKSFTVAGKGMEIQSSESMFNTADVVEKGGVVGEYTARLNLKRYAPEGTLISPVIDLWSEPDKSAVILPFTEVEKLTLSFRGNAPAGTRLTWQIRAGLSMDPMSAADWSEWNTVAEGASAVVEPKGRVPMPPSHWDPERSVTLPKIRYMQWRAVLATTDPLKTPTVESVSVDREITRRMEVPANIMVREWRNPKIRYSSTGFTYQSADEPMNQVVRDRNDLEALVKGAGGEFDAIVRMLDFASRRWIWSGPGIEYPKWNAVDTGERIESMGQGGMCIQFAAYLVHILTVMGFQARHVNIISHEVVEVWSNDFEKWIYLDPTQSADIYCYDKTTGVPLSLLDMHKAHYDFYHITTPIDWMAPPPAERKPTSEVSRLPFTFSTTDPRVELAHPNWAGYFTNVQFLRMMPRNDFSTTTIPEPLQQGMMQWPWNGYINWYDRLAPPKLQYSRHTDRECDFWPTLSQVRFEAVPEINGDMIFIAMTTFTPSFKTFQVKVDEGVWKDSDDRFVWRLHTGRNRLEMRAVSKFGVAGRPSFMDINFVAKHIPKPVPMGGMDQ